jgi:hypothetical protein
MWSFTQGLAAVKIKEKWGYINKKGKIVISPRFDEAYSYGEFDLAVVRIDSKYGYIDKTGKIIIPVKFDSASWFSDGLAIVKINSIFGNNLGYINRTGKIIIKPQFEYAEYFKNSRARVKKNNFIFTEEGLIDKTGKWIIKTKKINHNSLPYLIIIVINCVMFLIRVNPMLEFLMLPFLLIIFVTFFLMVLTSIVSIVSNFIKKYS